MKTNLDYLLIEDNINEMVLFENLMQLRMDLNYKGIKNLSSYDEVVDKTDKVVLFLNRFISHIEHKLNITVSYIKYANKYPFTKLEKGFSEKLFADKNATCLFHKDGSSEMIEAVDVASNVVGNLLKKILNDYLDVLGDADNPSNDISTLTGEINDIKVKASKTFKKLNGKIRNDIENGGGITRVNFQYIIDEREKFTKQVRDYYKTLKDTLNYMEELKSKIKDMKVYSSIPLKGIMHELTEIIRNIIYFDNHIKNLIRIALTEIYGNPQ